MEPRSRWAVALLLAALGWLPASAAALTARYAHTSTLLANGNILLAGGLSGSSFIPINSLEVLSGQGGAVSDVGATLTGGSFVAVASQTATLMPNGEVLIAGGITGDPSVAGNVYDKVQIYNPVKNCFRTPIQMTKAAGSGRYDHTATLLQNGDVLLCGGLKAGPPSPSARQDCDIFHPTMPAAGSSIDLEKDCTSDPGGTMDATGVTLAIPRAGHSATLLSDGRVFITGGLDPDAGTAGHSLEPYMVTSEIYTPGSATTASAAPLSVGRAYHRASLMGNGKVLIVGGYDGGNPGSNIAANRGYLDSVEIYDPVADHMSPAAAMPMRVSEHAQATRADGSVYLNGGLGNITTTYFNPSGGLDLTRYPSSAPSPLGTFPGGSAYYTNLSSANVFLPGGTLTLGTKVTGLINDGFVLFSTPSLSFTGGIVYFTPGAEDPTTGALSGAYASLDGHYVGCGAASCGQDLAGFFHVAADAGKLTATPATLKGSIASMDDSSGNSYTQFHTSTVSWTPAPLCTTNAACAGASGDLLSSTELSGSISLSGLPAAFNTHNILSASLNLTGGLITVASGGQTIYTISLSAGTGVFQPGSFSAISADNSNSGLGKFTATVDITGITGTVTSSTPDPYVTAPGSPGLGVGGLSLQSVTGLLSFAVDGADFNDSGDQFKVDVATVVIRQMGFSDTYRYEPNNNAWAVTNQSINGLGNVFGPTATVTPAGSVVELGGRDAERALNPFAVDALQPFQDFASGGSMLSARANETSTLLPNGKILLVGGTNGPNVLPTAELYDPKTQATTPTGPMNVARDLHTATLLPNGRVLVTGGFATTATSTGSTSAAELYFPGTNNWVQTSSMPFAADNHTATLLPDGNVLVAGGFENGVYLSSAAIYITTAAAWMPLPHMNDGSVTPPTPATEIPRALQSATLLQDGRVLLAGGVNQTGVLCSSIIFDPAGIASGRPWYKGNDIMDPAVDARCSHVQSHTATGLLDGRVLLTGGTDGVSETNSSYLYTSAPNPLIAGSTGTWVNVSRMSAAGVLNNKRLGHSAMLLPNGQVLIMGGSKVNGSVVSSVELFDTLFSSFSSVGALTTGRLNSAATLGSDGYIYLFGGSNGLSVQNSVDRDYFMGAPPDTYSGASLGTRQPSLATVNIMPFRGFGGNGPLINVSGTNLQGLGESSGGSAGAGNSSFNNPRITLQALSAVGGTGSQSASDFALDLSTRLYTPSDYNNWATAKTTMTFQAPTDDVSGYSNGGFSLSQLGGNMLPYGWYHLRDGVNAVFSNSLLVQVGPSLPLKAPTNILAPTANLGVSSITWTWSNPGGMGTFDGWEVFSSSTGWLSTQTASGQTAWTQYNLAPNTAVSVAVAGYNVSGDGPLGFSTTYYTYASSPSFTAASLSTFTNVGFNSLTLNFDPDGNQPGTIYEIYQSTDNFVLNTTTPVPTIVMNVSTSVVIGQLQPNQDYYFKVRAFNGSLLPSPFSVVVTTKTRAPVSGLSGAPAGSPYDPTTTIQWTWVDPGGVSYYKIYNATVPIGGQGSLIGTSATPSFFDVGLATNNIRSVMVSAVTSAGEGPLSASATTYTLAAVPGPVTPGIVNLSTGSFTAFWTANGNPLFTTYQMIVLNPFGVAVATVDTNNFSAGFGGFPPFSGASQFGVEVDALNGVGAASNFLVLGTTFTLPDNPSNLSITGTTPNSISLAWATNNNSSSATYEVQYTTAVDFTNVGAIRKAVAFADKFNGNSITVQNLLTSTTYQFRVQAANPFGQLSAFTTSLTTSPFNGGAPLGSIAGPINHLQTTMLTGTIGNGRAMTLYVPAGAFGEDTFVTISTFNAAGAGSKCPGGVNVGVTITPNPYIQPLHPVYLTLGYSAGDLGAVPTAEAALNRVDASGTCVPLSTTFDTANNTFTSQLNHFSQFQLAAVLPSNDPSNTVAFPNPFMPTEGNGYVTFKNMPAGARVRIFTMRGQLVYDQNANGSGLATWGGTNRFGRPAASGVYLAVIESGSQKQILKVVVLR